MKLYKIIAVEDNSTLAVRFAGSEVAARSTRVELTGRLKLPKSGVNVSSQEVDTRKEGLLVLLNELAARGDADV